MDELTPRPGSMDKEIINEMQNDPYCVKLFINQGDIVLDAGANIGAFAEFVCHCTGNNIRLYCLEPIPSNLEILNKRFKGRPQCSIISKALMGESKLTTINDFGLDASGCHSIFALGNQESTKHQIESISLADLMQQYSLEKIDFLKLDVQGAEFDIIEKTPTVVMNRIKFIALELHTSIAKPGVVIGHIPQAQRKIYRLIQRLNKTHIPVIGWPMRDSVQVWKRRENASLKEHCLASIKIMCVYIFIFSKLIKKAIKGVVLLVKGRSPKDNR